MTNVYKNVLGLLEVDADEELATLAQKFGAALQQGLRVARREVADGGAGQKAEPPRAQPGGFSRQEETLGEIRADGTHRNARHVGGEAVHLAFEIVAADIHRHIARGFFQRIEKLADLQA